MKKINYLGFIFFAFSIFACNDDDDPVAGDTTAPTITIGSPTDGDIFNPGETINLQASVEDDVALQAISITLIYPNQAENTFERGPDDFTNDGRVDEILMDFTIPAGSLTGTYTISVDATDAEGNQSPTESVSIMVEADGGE